MKKILITISVMILGLVMMMIPNSYAVSNPENLTAATGTVTLQKLVHTNFSDPSNLPNFTFNFTKSEVTGTPVGGDVQNTVANMPSIASVTTTNSWTPATGDDVNANFTNSVIQTITANVTFTEVGTYTYTIREASNFQRNITNDTTEYKVVFDVAKTDTDGNGEYDALEVATQLLYNVTDNNTKVDAIKFTNVVEPFANVYVVKEVTGPKGDITKSFDFSITITDEGAHDYHIEQLTNGDWTTVTGSEGTITGGTPKTVSLKHNQRVCIEGVLVDTMYSASESNNNNYTTTYKIAGIANVNQGSSVSNVVVKETDNEVKFINNRDDIIDIDTGVIINTLPYLVLVSIAIIGLALILKKKNRSED